MFRMIKYGIMRLFFGVLVMVLGFTACVPAKKYNDLLEKQQNCSDELKKFKTSSLESESQLKTVQTKLNLLDREIAQLRSDTTDLGNSFRSLNAKYQQEKAMREAQEDMMNKAKSSSAKDLTAMRAELEAKILEVQRKEDVLLELEKELNDKQELLAKRQQRVEELEDIIRKQDEAVKALKNKISDALRGFEDKGLTVEERNGKIYVSLEAKLLFSSGSTAVSQQGKKAVVDLAKSIEHEEDLEIIVEGHTDTDPIRSAAHPKSNWELSVLRSTTVVEIMIDNSEISPAILSASGRSQFHPIDPNDKAKNRRIEVIIAPKLDQLFELISQ